MAKSSQNIVNKRIIVISEMMIEGKNRQNILQFNSENWGLSERQIDNYISKATSIIKSELIKDVEFDYSKAVRRYEDLYKLSLNKKDYKTAMSINEKLTALQGLNKIQVEHSGDVQFICNLPD